MFRKPKTRNIRPRQRDSSDDDGAPATPEVSASKPNVKEESPDEEEDVAVLPPKKSTLLSFDQDEDADVEVFKIKKPSKMTHTFAAVTDSKMALEAKKLRQQKRRADTKSKHQSGDLQPIMYPDLDQSEVVFVHKLASGEPTALEELHTYLKQSSADKDLTAETFMGLSKGLHYAMWMQDKQILQVELAENMASLIDDFRTHEEGALYVQVFFEALSGEWHLVDRWRMDKFLMAVRLLVRKVFNVMLQEEWAAGVVWKYLSTFKKTIISSKSTIVQSLKTHFASLYLVELSKTGKVSKEVSFLFFQPYLEVLQDNRASDFYFKSICDKVFQTLVYTATYEIKKSDIDGSDDSNDIVRILRADNPIPCDFEALGDRLFAIGNLLYEYRPKPANIFKMRREIGAPPSRHQRVYALSKKFKAIAQEKNPRKKPMNVSNEPVISQSKMKKAAEDDYVASEDVIE